VDRGQVTEKWKWSCNSQLRHSSGKCSR